MKRNKIWLRQYCHNTCILDQSQEILKGKLTTSTFFIIAIKKMPILMLWSTCPLTCHHVVPYISPYMLACVPTTCPLTYLLVCHLHTPMNPLCALYVFIQTSILPSCAPLHTLDLDLTVQGPLLVISDGQFWRPIHTCSLEDCSTFADIWWLLKHVWLASGQQASYWHVFLF